MNIAQQTAWFFFFYLSCVYNLWGAETNTGTTGHPRSETRTRCELS